MAILFTSDLSLLACEKINLLKRDFNNEYLKEPEKIKGQIEKICA